MQRTLSGVFFLVLFGPALLAGQQLPPQQAAQPQNGPSSSTTIAARAITPDAFSGTWDYNDALSVDAATGRPERAPRSATQRSLGNRGAGPAPAGTGTPVRPAGSGGSSGAGAPGATPGSADGSPRASDDAFRAIAAVIAAERRTYIRDLLEVPELLKIHATAEEVTIGDDLGRDRTYSTNGRLQKYQLSAARYQASGAWSDTYFRKTIHGANNFLMSETYFVSEDGNRLFVIIRVGDPRKPETLAGVNRVYDRVQGSR